MQMVCSMPYVNPDEPTDMFPIPSNEPESPNPLSPNENPNDAPSPG